ncbi:MAG: aminotransferase class I and II [Gemmatimonadetes bacterium]|nr:aminotransferase class I and II [Gemmatimonadota bacterium]MBT8405780.1 aminotransferase class I and II [Gemmatimonadota bacterium]NNK62111.1 aminotransferase class I and II [Gemmatimonadota bacterium]
MSPLPRHTALRYLEPLREGGSLPAIVEADGGLFVVKFRGAGQGALALVAEIVVGELARSLGLPVPELALVHVDAAFGRTEPDPEIQDLLRASHGINVGLEYLEGAFNFDPRAAGDLVSPELAAEVVWLDCWVTNPDRSARNPNLLVHRRRPWLIDHGAALYHQHDWSRVSADRVRAPFARISDHVLLATAADVDGADRRLAERLPAGAIDRAVEAVPEDLISPEDRERHREWLHGRFTARADWVAAAAEAQSVARARPRDRRPYRR